jgi:protein-tyrosine-phosphatase
MRGKKPIRMFKHVLFVCIFNVKRSVVAQHMLHKMLTRESGDYTEKIKVSSAGFVGQEIAEWFKINAIPYPDPLFNRTPPPLIQEVMKNRGVDIAGHRSRPVNKDILNRSHLIIPLLTILKRDLIAAYPEIENKIVLPSELLENETAFLWEDTTAVPNDSRMFDFAHGNKAYVTDVINEIEGFLKKSFGQILQYLVESEEKNIINNPGCGF